MAAARKKQLDVLHQRSMLPTQNGNVENMCRLYLQLMNQRFDRKKEKIYRRPQLPTIQKRVYAR